MLHEGGITIDEAFNQAQELAFAKDEQKELECAKTVPITFDEDCPETSPERALRFKQATPTRRTAADC